MLSLLVAIFLIVFSGREFANFPCLVAFWAHSRMLLPVMQVSFSVWFNSNRLPLSRR